MKKFIRQHWVIASATVALNCFASLAQAEVVVVVNPGNAVGPLNAEQVSNIFLGKAKSFPGGDNAAIPIDQAESAAVRAEFYSKVVGKDDAQIKAYWSRIVFTGKGTAPKEVSGSAEVKKLVSSNVNLIGYIEKSAVDSSVKVVLTSP